MPKSDQSIKTIEVYHEELSREDALLCEVLHKLIVEVLPEAKGKVWHGHPVWFLEDNPVVGYSKLKDNVRMLFWSGQSFDEPLLMPEGSFKAAEFRFKEIDDIQIEVVKRCLEKAREIQWDYKNIVKKKGVLELIEK